jgi:transcriptional regulator
MFHFSQYRSTDIALIRNFIAKFPLALIISQHNDQWLSSQIPVFFDESDDILFAHVDAKNSQFSNNQSFQALVIFMGPNLYIPPEAYASDQLPTWNYLAVHASGTVSVINDVTQNLDILRKTALQLAPTPSTFRIQDSDTRVGKWIGGIRGLRIELSQIEGRFKLSQDKTQQDVEAAAKYFAEMVGKRVTTEMLLNFSGLIQRAEQSI